MKEFCAGDAGFCELLEVQVADAAACFFAPVFFRKRALVSAICRPCFPRSDCGTFAFLRSPALFAARGSACRCC